MTEVPPRRDPRSSVVRRLEFSLRHLAEADLEAAHRLSLAVSWPHRLEDWRLFHALGRGIVACDEHDTLIGTAMWWPYGERAGTLGMVLVAPAQQGKGVGRALMGAILDDAGARAMMLNATEAGLPLYTSLGFRPTGAVQQHQGEFRAAAVVATGTRPAQAEDHPALMRLDAAAFGAPRSALVNRLLRLGDTMVNEADGRITGFSIRRAFGRGQAIGPLVAASEEDAIALVSALAAPGFLRIDIPSEAMRLAARLTEMGLAPVSAVTTMVRGTWPASSPDARRFALVSQALG